MDDFIQTGPREANKNMIKQIQEVLLLHVNPPLDEESKREQIFLSREYRREAISSTRDPL